MKKTIRLLIILTVLIGSHSVVFSKDKNLKTFLFSWANDIWVHTDHGFTNGFEFAWISKAIENPRNNSVFGWMAPSRKPMSSYVFSYVLRQSLFTPDDLRRKDVDENDRPYAGYLNFEVGAHSLSSRRMTFFSLSAGVIGPMALAEPAQKFVHKMIAAPIPQGWSHQLKNEPALQAYFQRRRKWTRSGRKEGVGIDLISHTGGGLGNIYTYANAGLQMRLGWNLPNDFGQPLLRPGGPSGVAVLDRETGEDAEYDGIYIYSAVDGQLVLRNIFLDGNTFVDSPRVEKDMFTGNVQIGFGFKVDYLYMNVALVRWSRLFKTQKKKQGNVTISLSYSF